MNEVVSQYSNDSPLCILCDMNVIETVSHFLFDCPYFKDIRQVHWQEVLDADPGGVSDALMNMTSVDRTVCIMRGYNMNDVEECQELFTATNNFCNKMYQCRRTL